MDLENELRQAMAEHVSEVSAPRTLAHDARRRHHRTVRRRAVIGVTAAGVVVAAAVLPTYHAFRPRPVDPPGPARPGAGHRPASGAQPSEPAGGFNSTPSVDPVPSRHSGSPPRRAAATPDRGSGAARVLLRYLPPGIGTASTCHGGRRGSRQTTTCRWAGSAGWIEVRTIRDKRIAGLSDLRISTPVPTHVSVRGRPALRGDVPSAFSQVVWIERDGLGVRVTVSPELSGRLARVADGVRVS